MSTQVGAPESVDDGAGGVQDEQLGDSGKRALEKEREARKAAEEALSELGGLSRAEVRKFVQESNEAKARLAELEAANMSDLEKAQAAAEAAQKEAEKSAREALRYRYAAKYGISDDDAALFLTGETEDVVKAQAERLAATVTKGGTPKPDLTQGGSGTTVPQTKGEMFADFIESKLV